MRPLLNPYLIRFIDDEDSFVVKLTVLDEARISNQGWDQCHKTFLE